MIGCQIFNIALAVFSPLSVSLFNPCFSQRSFGDLELPSGHTVTYFDSTEITQSILYKDSMLWFVRIVTVSSDRTLSFLFIKDSEEPFIYSKQLKTNYSF